MTDNHITADEAVAIIDKVDAEKVSFAEGELDPRAIVEKANARLRPGDGATYLEDRCPTFQP